MIKVKPTNAWITILVSLSALLGAGILATEMIPELNKYSILKIIANENESKYSITISGAKIENEKSDGYSVGDLITLIVDKPQQTQTIKWSGTEGLTDWKYDATTGKATFKMPAKNITLKAEVVKA